MGIVHSTQSRISAPRSVGGWHYSVAVPLPLTDLDALDQEDLGGASADFWRSNSDALITLAATQPAVRERLLGIFPHTYDADYLDEWLDVLAATGATDLLVGNDSAPGVPARWLGELLRGRAIHHAPIARSARLLDL